MDDALKHKLLAATCCVALSVTGMLTGMRWLTVAALVAWVLALAVFGFGSRNSPPSILAEELDENGLNDDRSG